MNRQQLPLLLEWKEVKTKCKGHDNLSNGTSLERVDVAKRSLKS